MDTQVHSNFAYMGRSFGNISSINDNSTAFSDCNSDGSGEFPTSSSPRKQLLIACTAYNSNDLIRQLVSDLDSCSIDEQKQLAMGFRLLAKNQSKNRIKIARAGAIKPLIPLIASSDPQLQEHNITTILNISLCDENKGLLASSGAIKLLVRALKIGTLTTKENTACALLNYYSYWNIYKESKKLLCISYVSTVCLDMWHSTVE